jgi:hypothetical protein
MTANAAATLRSLDIDIGFLLVKVPQETNPPERAAFLTTPVTQA